MKRKSEVSDSTSMDAKRSFSGLLYLAVILWISYASYQMSANSCDDRPVVPTAATATVTAPVTTTTTQTTTEDRPSSSIWTNREQLYSGIMALLQVAPAYEDSKSTSSTTSDHLLILQNFVRSPTHPRDDIVLVTQATTLQTESLSRLLQQWSGPASVAVYLNTPQCVERFVDYFLSTTTGDDAPAWGHQARYHLIMEKASLSSNQKQQSSMPPVPVNVMRNVALHSFEANYFLAVDVNLVLSPAPTYQQWRELQRQNPTLWEQTFVREKRLLYVPTFAPADRDTTPTVPKTQEELLGSVQKGDWVPVLSELLHKEHRDPVSNTEQWMQLAKEGSFFEPLQSDDPNSIRWEPNLMGYRPGIHRFYEGVRDSTFGKYGFWAESSLAGYSFGVWKNFYGLHYEFYEQTADSLTTQSEYQAAFQEYLTNRYSPSRRSRSEE